MLILMVTRMFVNIFLIQTYLKNGLNGILVYKKPTVINRRDALFDETLKFIEFNTDMEGY